MSYKNYLAALDADRGVCYYFISAMYRLEIVPPPGYLLMEYWFLEKRFNDKN
jgi:hypothetical protein